MTTADLIPTSSLPDLVPATIGGRSYTVEESFWFCMTLAKNHYENFPVASLVVPAPLRPYICAVYAFSRVADDFADEAEFEGSRMERLNEWEGLLKNIFLQEPKHPIFIALKATIEKFNIPVVLFENLIKAFKMDVMISRYDTFDQVLHYCRHSANPVGRIILHIFGYPAPRFMDYSDNICTALQLANFWQDIAIDLEKNRIYLPKEDFVRFQYSETELMTKTFNENFKRLLSFQVERTQELFDAGKPLGGKIPGRLGLELRLTWLGGNAILKKIRQNDWDIFKRRPKLKKRDYWSLFWNALKKRDFS